MSVAKEILEGIQRLEEDATHAAIMGVPADQIMKAFGISEDQVYDLQQKLGKYYLSYKGIKFGSKSGWKDVAREYAKENGLKFNG